MLTTASDYPEVIYLLSFEYFDTAALTVKKINQSSFAGSTILLTKANTNTYTILPFVNFKRLQTLQTLNKKYGSSDLNLGFTTNIAVPAGSMCLFDTGKTYSCSNIGYYLGSYNHNK